jgi:hypothetical protein
MSQNDLRYWAAACQTDFPTPGEKVVVSPIDVAALRDARARRQGHHKLGHLRTEAYPVYKGSIFEPGVVPHSYDRNVERIERAKAALDSDS